MTEPDPHTIPDTKPDPDVQADINARGIRNVRRAIGTARGITETTSSDEPEEKR